MRLKAEIWVKAYIRRCASKGVPAVVVHHGDDDAGAIFIRVSRLDGTSLLFGPAPAGLDGAATDRQWTRRLSPAGQPDEETDAYLARETRTDPDLWLVEVEDREGRHFLEDELVTP
jgi:hypothetical protein